ncbi:DUF6600 domain-containing protein [Acidobacterium sp. S8]|uniref:DUF6600 domain-containing protein n=1 Tax=Acidobacterium sp. S8 TaxID=1641854 RepID=UPI00131BCF7B|nr:DUF6600 domain-containing protein [Acidobacterium sp. S8]
MRHLDGSKSRLIFHLLLASVLAPVTFSQGTNNVRAVRISHVEGTVQLLDDKGVVFDQAHVNMPVTQGMHIKTGDDGRVEIQFEDGSVARATPNSAINFTQLQRSSDGNTITRLQPVTGLTYYEFNNRGGTYGVQFGPYKVTTTKDTIFRVNINQNPVKLAVMRGSVHVETGDENGVEVAKNQTVTLDTTDSSRHEVAQSVAPDTGDLWNADRDKIVGQIGARATMARSLTGSPNDPAWNDLDYYGNWYSMPGYGMGWMPAGVGAGWDPFASGYWGYYPSSGYTWISNNPWGWMPYHCGAWNYFNGGPGWMWFPGNCGYGAYGNGWYPTAAVWNVPRKYTCPKRPGSPVRGPEPRLPAERLIPVNRDPGKFQYRTVGGEKPVATHFKFEGKTLQPIETSVQPRTTGPLGESFRVASGSAMPPIAHSGAMPVQGGHGLSLSSGALPVANQPRSTLSSGMPRSTFAAPPHFSAPPTYHAAPSSSGAMMSSSSSSTSSMSSGAHASSAPSFSGASASSGAVASGGGGAHVH